MWQCTFDACHASPTATSVSMLQHAYAYTQQRKCQCSLLRVIHIGQFFKDEDWIDCARTCVCHPGVLCGPWPWRSCSS
eukprot:m.354996 g.354996  ORF g.354996 m.354996 type:complete len:78 (+) comp17152_c0_seq1:203-436(+)